VVGGVLGLAALIGLLAWFLLKRRKSKQHAFDEKTVSRLGAFGIVDLTNSSTLDIPHMTL